MLLFDSCSCKTINSISFKCRSYTKSSFGFIDIFGEKIVYKFTGNYLLVLAVCNLNPSKELLSDWSFDDDVSNVKEPLPAKTQEPSSNFIELRLLDNHREAFSDGYVINSEESKKQIPVANYSGSSLSSVTAASKKLDLLNFKLFVIFLHEYFKL